MITASSINKHAHVAIYRVSLATQWNTVYGYGLFDAHTILITDFPQYQITKIAVCTFNKEKFLIGYSILGFQGFHGTPFGLSCNRKL